ncbi:MAG: hypothetical protein E7345_02920 [Clostridiales bacterium]|nr:hypothetical protein [Clostridiales bacterium]
MKINNNNNYYKIIKDKKNQECAICFVCHKNNIISYLIEDWKPYEEGLHQHNFYYTCPIHTEISIVTDIKLPLKKD